MTPAFIADLDGVWWVATPTAVAFDRQWLHENFGPSAADGGYERQEPSMSQAPEEPVAKLREPLYWLRQRNGNTGTAQLTAAEAAQIAQRPGAVGNYLSTAGLTWRELDPDVPGGFAYFTLTPVYQEPRHV